VAADSLLQRAFASRRSSIAVADEGKGAEELIPSPGDLISASDFAAISGLVASADASAKPAPAVLLAQSVDEVFPDFPDPTCVLHSTCTRERMSGPRGLCVLPTAGWRLQHAYDWITGTNASGNASNMSKECWDVCNLTHAPAEYASAEGELAEAVVESVAKIRSGEYASVTCPGASAEGHVSVNGTPAATEPLSSIDYARIFPDTPDRSCDLGQPCTTAGIPASRGLCVLSVDGPGWAYTNANECWDICNASHAPKAYKTGSRDLDQALAKLVHVVRHGRHPSIFCPKRGSSDTPAASKSGAFTNEVFADTLDPDCTPRGACTAGGIPALRGVCVVVVSSNISTNLSTNRSTNRTECWDVCNRRHAPEKYVAVSITRHWLGDPVVRVVAGIRADKYPNVRCPSENTQSTQPSKTTFVGCKTCRDKRPPSGAMMPVQTPTDHRVRLPQ